ncbi:hypothetical protein Y032_0012g1763 [Ancylostoma ceylanicum]|uniref:Protein arginine methyltransferase NDUFAF7 n=1 Tax=Ancylostoma ceylanicum TaxID=53326 RepID=A0A016VC15_9BILA|nr:hypothetical protein Y032_0012g1763 [Ancylostoma ceylanicum]
MCVLVPSVLPTSGTSDIPVIFGASDLRVPTSEISILTSAHPCCRLAAGPGSGMRREHAPSERVEQEKNMSVHLVETSDALIEQQEKLLCDSPSTSTSSSNYGKEAFVRKNTTKSGVPIFWYKTLADVPEAFSIFVANEFLDALPVHQFSRCADGMWHEVYVNIDKGNELCFMNSRGENLHTRGLLPEEVRSDKERKHWECSPEAGTFVNEITERIVYNGGFGIIIDYGHDGSRKDLSFRAYEKHQLVNPLSKPGAIDLTADVNFGYLKSLVVDRAAVFGPNTQRSGGIFETNEVFGDRFFPPVQAYCFCEASEFLAQLGAEIRLRRLLKSCNDREKQEILIKSYNFLMGDMGERFLAMSIFPKTLTGILEKRGGPAGFALPRQSASVENS